MLVARLRRSVDILHTSHFFAGLFKHSDVRLIVDESIGDAIEHDDIVRLEAPSGKFVIDFSDHANFWDEAGLDWCDVYLKRNVREPLPPKVVPYGVNFNARGIWSALRLGLFQRDMARFLRLLRTPHWKQFEHAPDRRVDDVVLLQTRLWPHDESGNDEQINHSRIELVNSLRNHFGNRFRGGLVDNPIARQMAPALISEMPSRQRDFIRWQKRCKVGVYVPGLFGSVGFKLAEYLASSKAIVSPPLDCVFPAPLEHGTHLLTFRSDAECIAACERMLSVEGDAFRAACWEYYRKNVRLGQAAMWRIFPQTAPREVSVPYDGEVA